MLADRRAEIGLAAEAAAHQHLEAELAGVVAVDAQADVVDLGRRPVPRRAGDGDLELARQERELGVEGRPLADHLGPDARIVGLVGGGAGVRVGGDVADVVAAGLDGVHPDLGQVIEDVRRVLQLDPVQLDVGARGEVAVPLVVGAGDVAELAQLPRGQRAIGDGDPQHVGVQLQIQAVHQPDAFELVLGELAGEPARALLAELRDAVGQHFLVDGVVAIHAGASSTCA